MGQVEKHKVGRYLFILYRQRKKEREGKSATKS